MGTSALIVHGWRYWVVVVKARFKYVDSIIVSIADRVSYVILACQYIIPIAGSMIRSSRQILE